MKFLQLRAFTKENRMEMTSKAKAAIEKGGGWILRHQQFSNISLCLNFECPVSSVEKLYRSLLDTGLELSDKSVNAFQNELELQAKGSVSKGDFIGTLQITFIHDEPDMRVVVPAVPG